MPKSGVNVLDSKLPKALTVVGAAGQTRPSGMLKMPLVEGKMKAGPLGQCLLKRWVGLVPPLAQPWCSQPCALLLGSTDYSTKGWAYCWDTLSTVRAEAPCTTWDSALPALELHLSEICRQLSHPSAWPGRPSMPLHSRRLSRHLAKLNRFSSFNLSSLAGNLERKQMLTPYRFKLLL